MFSIRYRYRQYKLLTKPILKSVINLSTLIIIILLNNIIFFLLQTEIGNNFLYPHMWTNFYLANLLSHVCQILYQKILSHMWEFFILKTFIYAFWVDSLWYFFKSMLILHILRLNLMLECRNLRNFSRFVSVVKIR